MKSMLIIARRELIARYAVFAAALVIGISSLLSPHYPGLDRFDAGEAIASSALVLAFVFASLFSLLLGASIIGRELEEERLGFYFARPISALAIWGGKMLAAFVLVLGSQALVLLPALLAVGPDLLNTQFLVFSEFYTSIAEWLPVSPFVLFPLFLLVFAHAVGIMWRARSLWLVLDIIAPVLLVMAGTRSAQRLVLVFAQSDMWLGLAWLFMALPVVLLAAGAAQVVRGRTNARRGHATISLTLWPLAALCVLGFEIYSHWVVSAGPDDLVTVYGDVRAAPQGSWIAFGGKARGRVDYHPTFLLDTESGRYIRMGSVPMRSLPLVSFSDDGTRATWMAPTGPHPSDEARFMTMNLDAPKLNPQAMPLTFPHAWYPCKTMSPDGELVAELDFNGVLQVHSLKDARLLASARLGKGSPSAPIRFVTRDKLRIWRFEPSSVNDLADQGSRDPRPGSLRISELDFQRGSIKDTGRIHDLTSYSYQMNVDHQSTHLLLERKEKGFSRFSLHDAVTGDLLVALLPGKELQQARSRFLTHGGFVIASVSAGKADFDVFSSDGQHLRTAALGHGVRAILGRETESDVLVVALAQEGPQEESVASYLVDLMKGTRQLLGEGIMPWNSLQRPGTPGGISSRLFIEKPSEKFLEVDPHTGTRRVLIQTCQG